MSDLKVTSLLTIELQAVQRSIAQVLPLLPMLLVCARVAGAELSFHPIRGINHSGPKTSVKL